MLQATTLRDQRRLVSFEEGILRLIMWPHAAEPTNWTLEEKKTKRSTRHKKTEVYYMRLLLSRRLEWMANVIRVRESKDTKDLFKSQATSKKYLPKIKAGKVR